MRTDLLSRRGQDPDMGARKQAGTGSLTCAQGLCGSKSEDSNPPQDTVTQVRCGTQAQIHIFTAKLTPFGICISFSLIWWGTRWTLTPWVDGGCWVWRGQSRRRTVSSSGDLAIHHLPAGQLIPTLLLSDR